jgi:hypothetical protein
MTTASGSSVLRWRQDSTITRGAILFELEPNETAVRPEPVSGAFHAIGRRRICRVVGAMGRAPSPMALKINQDYTLITEI